MQPNLEYLSLQSIPDFLSRLLNLGTGDSERFEDFLGDLLLLLQNCRESVWMLGRPELLANKRP